MNKHEKDYCLTTLKKVPELFAETISLIEKEFNYPNGYKFEIDFYPLVSKNNFHNNHIILFNGKVVGHVGVKIKLLGNSYLKMPVALLGGIVVDGNFQGQKLLRFILNSVIETYKNKVGLFILWSDLESLYKKFNFFLAGGQIETGCSKLTEESEDTESFKNFKRTKFHLLSEDDFNQIKNIHATSTCSAYTTFFRDEKDWSDIKNITSSDLFIQYGSNNKISSYFCVNKGHDLKNVIHEIGYLPDFKNSLINTLSQYSLWLPEKEAHTFNFAKSKLMYLALFRMGSEKMFSEFIKKWSNLEIEIKKISVENNEICFLYQSNDYSFSIEEFFTFIWGPHPLPEFKDFNLPLYFPGVDSI